MNSYGQIGGTVSPWLCQSTCALKYGLRFSIALEMELACMVMIIITWLIILNSEKSTRDIKRARVEAGRKGEAVLEDVEIDEDG